MSTFIFRVPFKGRNTKDSGWRFAGAGQAKLRAGYPAQDPTCRSGTAGLGEGSSGEAAGGLSSHRA